VPDFPALGTLEQLLAHYRPFVTQVIQEVARRQHLSAAEIADLDAAVERALERNDYELLRAFEGRSAWETYLATIVTRQFFESQAARWGDWRPSARARHAGPAAVLLEELVLRERLPLNNAIETMRTTHRVDIPPRKLEALAHELGLLSARARNAGSADIAPETSRLDAALRSALALLRPDDRLILALRYIDRAPLATIAKLMQIDSRPLQRHIDQLKAKIRTTLLAQGVAPHRAEELLEEGLSSSRALQDRWQAVLPRPSH
jgi:RNA polymerase sigma factor (sigma-70 family)